MFGRFKTNAYICTVKTIKTHKMETTTNFTVELENEMLLTGFGANKNTDIKPNEDFYNK